MWAVGRRPGWGIAGTEKMMGRAAEWDRGGEDGGEEMRAVYSMLYR